MPADFGPDELRRAFRNASRATHPDKRSGSAERFALVGIANDALGDAGRRRAFDAGEHLDRPQAFSLTEELTAHYWPELRAWEPFGDPLEKRHEHDARRAEKPGPGGRFGRLFG